MFTHHNMTLIYKVLGGGKKSRCILGQVDINLFVHSTMENSSEMLLSVGAMHIQES